MPHEIDDQELRRLLEEATPGPWYYRPEEHDDWGAVRLIPAGTYELDYNGPIFANVSVSTVNEETKAEFRRRLFEDGERCDPVQAEARLIALAPTLAQAYLDLRERVEELEGAIIGDAKRFADISRSIKKEAERGVITDTLWMDHKCPETMLDFASQSSLRLVPLIGKRYAA